jgi:hypothetical protein
MVLVDTRFQGHEPPGIVRGECDAGRADRGLRGARRSKSIDVPEEARR